MKSFFERTVRLDANNYIVLGHPFYINEILLFLTVGIAIACVLTYFYKRSASLLLRRLLRKGALGEEKAKTVAELGLKPGAFLKKALTESGEVSHLVKRVGAVRLTYEEYKAKKNAHEKVEDKIDFSTAKFYLDPADADRAEAIYAKDRTSPIHTALLVLLIFALYVGLALLMPSILSLVASLF